jgi:hypothetical protein
VTDTIDKLESLAAWHRFNASHANSIWVWEARLRIAEDLERSAKTPRVRQHDTIQPDAQWAA